MSMERRIERLEEIAESKEAAYKDLLLVYSNNMEVEGEIVRMPSPDQNGEALLHDGTRMPIIYEEDWMEIDVMQTDDPPSEPDGFLRIRRGDTLHIIHKMV